jgi:hypothetical protein
MYVKAQTRTHTLSFSLSLFLLPFPLFIYFFFFLFRPVVKADKTIEAVSFHELYQRLAIQTIVRDKWSILLLLLRLSRDADMSALQFTNVMPVDTVLAGVDPELGLPALGHPALHHQQPHQPKDEETAAQALARNLAAVTISFSGRGGGAEKNKRKKRKKPLGFSPSSYFYFFFVRGAGQGGGQRPARTATGCERVV